MNPDANKRDASDLEEDIPSGPAMEDIQAKTIRPSLQSSCHDSGIVSSWALPPPTTRLLVLRLL